MSTAAETHLNPFLDAEAQKEHRQRNLTHSVLLIGGIAAILVVAAYLLSGLTGILFACLAVAFLVLLAPRVPPETVMKLYRAKRVDNSTSPLSKLNEQLAQRAQLENPPTLYVIPSATLNAFATGTPDHAVIGISEGLLRQLTMREITGVIAHEMSHIKNNDVWLMGLADVMSRFVQSLSYAALFLAALNIFGMASGAPPMSWLAIIILYFAPTLTSLLQLGLSRAREFDADLEAAMLTGDPSGLASALQRLENHQGRFWEDMMMPVPSRRVPVPSILRTHPPTDERIKRLLALDPVRSMPRIAMIEEPMVSMIGMGPIEMRPRYRFPGLWF
ncbi:MAG: zinc metalloprotease HtpX [Pseudomonadota bacterium]